MYTRLQNMKFSSKILIATIVPIILCIIFAFKLINKSYDSLQNIKQIETLSELSVHMSNLVHEQQKERGASAGFLNSKGIKFREILTQQREMTNEKKSVFMNYIQSFDANQYGAKFVSAMDSLIRNLRKMDSIRAKVDDLSILRN